MSTRDPFGHIPPPEEVHHELVDLAICTCGLKAEGPGAERIMLQHVKDENDWEE